MGKMPIYGHIAIVPKAPSATKIPKLGIPEKSYKNEAQQY